MKNVIRIIILLILFSCNHIKKEKRVLIQKKGDAVMVVNIPKAACKKCQRIIEEGLQNESGVQQSILDLHTKRLSVVYTPEETSSEILGTTIEKLAKQIPCK
ncbi:heavy-metal-associated domain-containing protein [Aquimarina sp. MMG016]|uniref:cation transporter n=1 Tax=Aquimarina sp. MMG016 TaxID=2822690 RepID=UPI001B3A2694|nr:heavy-metal-associated domain-containing protein [Aquimarina sp. MMG016]MBQ4822882.1 heavy-metal-associated domain-containing protein [Aquimarina sp. MMG016]